MAYTSFPLLTPFPLREGGCTIPPTLRFLLREALLPPLPSLPSPPHSAPLPLPSAVPSHGGTQIGPSTPWAVSLYFELGVSPRQFKIHKITNTQNESLTGQGFPVTLWMSKGLTLSCTHFTQGVQRGFPILWTWIVVTYWASFLKWLKEVQPFSPTWSPSVLEAEGWTGVG